MPHTSRSYAVVVIDSEIPTVIGVFHSYDKADNVASRWNREHDTEYTGYARAVYIETYDQAHNELARENNL